MQSKVIPNVTATLIAALEDIKEIISQDPNREVVGQSSLTLVKIYQRTVLPVVIRVKPYYHVTLLYV